MTTVPDRCDTAEEPAIDQSRVRRLFAQPEKLADSAFLRREIADRMHERLSYIKAAPRVVLDAGCGEGGDLPRLQKRYPDARVLGVDASLNMLKYARIRSGGRRTDFVCADFGRLPLADGAADMLWSNLALHWHARPQQVCAEWQRVLKQGGLLMFSCFGPDTLRELRAAFAGVDSCSHTMPFVDMHALGDLLLAAGFPSPVLDRETITVTYSEMDKLFADVRAFGGNPLVRHRQALLGKHAWSQVLRNLDKNRDAVGRMPLSFEIIYAHAFRDEPTEKRPSETMMHFMPRVLKPDNPQ